MLSNDYVFSYITQNASSLAQDILELQYSLQPELKQHYSL